MSHPKKVSKDQEASHEYAIKAVLGEPDVGLEAVGYTLRFGKPLRKF